MIQKKPIKYFFEDTENLFKKKTTHLYDSNDIDITFSCMFDPELFKAIKSSKPLTQKAIRLYKIKDDSTICLIVKYDYFCNTLRGHLKTYNGKIVSVYTKTNDMFYDTGYRSKKEIYSVQSYYEKKKGEYENNGID